LDSPVELHYIKPEELQEYWDLIRPGLETVRNNAGDGWIAEDIYYALKSKQSSLHLAYHGQEYVGFVVLTPIQHYDCKHLHIWCAYNIGEKEILELVIPQLEAMAKSIGARKLTFGSPRKWDRRLKDFTPVRTIYEKEV